MYIRKSERKYKDKVYMSYVLVESVHTARGPRQKTICTLGSLEPRPAAEWLKLAHKVEDALVGQLSLEGSDPEVGAIVEKVRARQAAQRGAATDSEELVSVQVDDVEVEEVREVGAVHVGQQFYQRLGIEEVLAKVGLSPRGRLLSEVMILNRLVAPSSEHAMPGWVRRTALDDLLGEPVSGLAEDALYRNLDRLYPQREMIEKELWARERTLFGMEDTVYLYDLTSTYFEGRCPYNALAQHGYSRDGRPDCKQVVIGLVIDREGFPKAHEVFPGNRSDGTTVETMLELLEKRGGPKEGALVVVDRGMASPENLGTIRKRKHDYVVASRQSERDPWLAEFEEPEGWTTIKPRSRSCAGVRIRQLVVSEDEALVLCRSESRAEKDRAVREKQEGRLLEALQRLADRIANRRLQDPLAVHQRIGRLRERYPRVARYWKIDYDAEAPQLSWTEHAERKAKAVELDGAYLLKTSRTDMAGDDIWRTYTLLTRVENAFRAMKSPLAERPIFHQLQRRVETHIFLCVLAYHLLVAIEKTLRDRGIHSSWATIRQTLSTHQTLTVVLPTTNGHTLRIRKASHPEPQVRELYAALKVPTQPIKPVRTLCRPGPP